MYMNMISAMFNRNDSMLDLSPWDCSINELVGLRVVPGHIVGGGEAKP